MSNKQQLGQFMTTNFEYILQNMYISKKEQTIIEPFCGNGDLLKFVSMDKYKLECYDIEPKHDYIIQRDTIMDPPLYKNKFVLTNPPYLARNKSKDKSIFDKYKVNDLFKCFIVNLINDPPNGGIIIIPLNFICSIRQFDIDLRKRFLNIFTINRINIFEESVFEDTTYTICSIWFELGSTTNTINTMIYPSKESFDIILNDDTDYTIGGEIYKLNDNKQYTITRLTKKNIKEANTNILIKCIDDNADSQLGLSIVDDANIFIDNTSNSSARSYATLIINPAIDMDKQKKLVAAFNEYISCNRKKYHSLFLTNYRESKDIARKRISFTLVYSICKFLLSDLQ